MRNRLIVYLDPQEMSILTKMIEQDMRPADAQLRYLLVAEAKRRGLLQGNTKAPAEVSQAQAGAFAIVPN